MATYLNGYTLLEKVRVRLNEYSTAYCQATDTTGKYSNDQIMDGINDAQRFLFSFLLKRIPYQFEVDVALTGVSSVYTLPADFGVLRYFKDSDGYQIHPIGTQQRKTTSATGSDQHYYRKGNTLVIDKAGITEINTLTYFKKCRELTQGVTSAGAATSATLATSAKAIIDYYNGLTIENITDSTVDVISDYTAARVATVTNTWTASKYYGTVSDIPEPFHHLMIPRAVFEITANYPVVQEKPTKSGKDLFMEDLYETLSAYAGPTLDTYDADMWIQRDGYGGQSINSLIPDY